MFIDYSNMLNEMCGALPVSAEDAPGLQAAADRLKGRDVSGPKLPYIRNPDRYFAQLAWNALCLALSDLQKIDRAACSGVDQLCYGKTLNSVKVAMDELRGVLCSVDDQLSRDLIDAARDAKGG